MYHCCTKYEFEKLFQGMPRNFVSSQSFGGSSTYAAYSR
eukprot:SAG22_NODE_7600_length_725_cov_1.321086_1_plen_38_part_10